MFSEMQQGEATGLLEEDIRAVLRLAGETATMPFDHAARKSRLMHRLCELTTATAWTSAMGRQSTSNGRAVFAAFEQGGFDQKRFTRYLAAVEHSEVRSLSASLVDDLPEARTVVIRRDQIRLLSKEARELWREADLGPAIISLRPMGNDVVSGIAIYRRLDAPSFSLREYRIVDLILSELSWLHDAGWAGDSTAKILRLYPRERVIFNLLLQGYGRKIISDHLGISINTVSGYIKSIYKHFGVQSHAALMRYCRATASGTHPAGPDGDPAANAPRPPRKKSK